MKEDINKKVINLFTRHKKDLGGEDIEKVKFFEGFHYVKLDRDKNGKKFNPENLKKYAKSCHYVVRVMRSFNGETYLYNYDVANEDLYKFLEKFENNTLNGTIIEVERYFPEDLA